MRYHVTETPRGWNVILTPEAHDYPEGFYVTDGECCVYDREHRMRFQLPHDPKRFPSRPAEIAANTFDWCPPNARVLRRMHLRRKPFGGKP